MTFHEQAGTMWLDGEFIQNEAAHISLLTHTLHYGVGVFEGVRCYQTEKGPAIFRLKEHTERLLNSARILKMAIPYEETLLNQIQCDIINHNKLTSAYIRPMVFYGSDYLGLQTKALQCRVMIAAWKWGSYFNADTQGIKVHTSSFIRHHSNSVLCKAKANGNYINSIMALQEANDQGCDEALMLDHQGLVAEGSSANVFIVRNGKLYTPNRKSILEGITRATVMTIARDEGIEVVETDLTRDELYIASEIFFTGTAAEITPVAEIDGRSLSKGTMTQFLQQRYQAIVQGKEKKYQDWLTVI